MKIRRHKHTKRVLKYYHTNFKFDTKFFNVLVDGTFANEALNSKINIAEQMPKFFDVKENKCKLWTTKCAIHETEMLGKPTYGAMLILKQYQLVECKHKRNFVPSEKCFKDLISKSDTKYIVATQSESLKKIVRETPGVPLMIISHNAINLEKPSENTDKVVNKQIESRMAPKKDEMEMIKKLKQQLLDQKPVKRLHKKKKPKGPNPLSCKKKQKKSVKNK